MKKENIKRLVVATVMVALLLSAFGIMFRAVPVRGSPIPRGPSVLTNPGIMFGDANMDANTWVNITVSYTTDDNNSDDHLVYLDLMRNGNNEYNYTMNEVNASDTTWSDGKDFYYNATYGNGTYTYKFIVMNTTASAMVTELVDSNFTFTIVDTAPTIDVQLLEDRPFVDTIAVPHKDVCNLTIQVTITDPDITNGEYSYVPVQFGINGTDPLIGDMIEMDGGDTNYADGKQWWTQAINFSDESGVYALGDTYNLNQTGYHLAWVNVPAANFNTTNYLWVNEMWSQASVTSSDAPNATLASTYTFFVNLTSNLTTVNDTVNLTVNGVDMGYMTPQSATDNTYAYPDGRNFTMVVTGTPIQEGMNTYKFNNSNSSSPEYVFWVDRSPVFGVVDNSTPATSNLEYTLTFPATDDDGDMLTWAIYDTNITTGAMIDPYSGMFTWTPTDADANGEWWVNVSVDDGNGTVVYKNVTITVTPLHTGIFDYDIDAWYGTTSTYFNVTLKYRNDTAGQNFTTALVTFYSLDTSTEVSFGALQKVNESDYNWSDYVEYYYNTTLPVSGDYILNFSFANETGVWDNYTGFNGPHVDYPLELSNLTVIPTMGNTGTVFTFLVNYTDKDGDMPTVLNLTIDKDIYGIPIDTGISYMELDPLDMDVTDGKWYGVSLSNLPIGPHSFGAYAENMWSSGIIDVDEAFWVNLTLTNFDMDVDPTAEDAYNNTGEFPVNTPFDFTVDFWSYDNFSAVEVRLVVYNYDTDTYYNYTMMASNASDNDTTDGKAYYINDVVLPGGFNYVWVWANDTNNETVTTYWMYVLPVQSVTTGAIVGKVTDGTNNISGATVTLLNDTGGEVDSTTTNATGGYQFTGVDPGIYNVTVLAEGYYFDYNATVNVTVGGITIADFVLTPWATGGIMVHVVDEDGNNLTGVSVSVSSATDYYGYTYDGASNASVDNVTTFDDLPLVFNPYNVSASKAGYESVYNNNVTVPEGDYAHVYLTLVLIKGAINGTVTLGGEGIADVPITLINDTLGSYNTTTNATGYYEITGIIPGEYTLSIPESTEVYEAYETTVTIVGGDTLTKDIALTAWPVPTNGTLEVTVKDNATNATIANATVTVDSVQKQTDTSGVATFDLAAGDYTVTVTAEGYEANSAQVTVVAGETTSVEIKLDKTTAPVQTIDFSIGPFQTSDGTPISGATVTLTVGTSTYTATTDSNGNAQFTNVTVPEGGFPANVTVTFESTYGTQTLTVPGSALTDGATIDPTTYGFEPPTQPTQTVSFTLGPFKDKDGNPIEGATITITVGGQTYTATTDKDGYAHFTNIPVADLTGTISGTFKHKDYNDGKAVSFTFDGATAAGGGTEPVSVDVSEPIEKNKAEDNTLMYAVVAIIIVVIILVVVAMMMRKKPAEEAGVAVEEEAAPGFEEEALECECPNCGAAVTCEAEVCPECGEEFVLDEFKCPTCGAMVSAEDTVCPECGEEFVVGGEEEEIAIEEEEGEEFEEGEEGEEFEEGEEGEEYEEGEEGEEFDEDEEDLFEDEEEEGEEEEE